MAYQRSDGTLSHVHRDQAIGVARIANHQDTGTSAPRFFDGTPLTIKIFR